MSRLSRKQPSLGVVVPCHDNSWQLGGILKSLHYQTVSVEKVVVVDDNSNPTEENRLRSLAKELGARYRKLPAPRNRRETLGRRSHARNVGTKSLDTDIILYLDGDMLLGPRYVEEIKHYHAALQNVYIRGNRYAIPTALQANGMQVCLNQVAKQHIPAETLPSSYIIRPADFIGMPAYRSAYYDKWQWCASNNLSVRNEHASQIGYWDENFAGWGEEDMDFSFRLYQLGLTPLLLVSDNAAAYHLEHPVDYQTHTLTLKENGRYLINKFPEIAQYRKEAYVLHGVNMEDFGPG